MRWPFGAKPPTQASFPVGAYRLDSSIRDLTGLSELSPEEYKNFLLQFEDEKIYNAPPVLGCSWNLTLGTVHDRIYKIAPYLLLDTKIEANPIADETLHYCLEQLGKPAVQRTGWFTWHTTDGNVILQTAVTPDGLSINLFLTSRAVRTFQRL